MIFLTSKVATPNILEILRQVNISLRLDRGFGFKNIKDTVMADKHKFNKQKISLKTDVLVLIELYKVAKLSKTSEPNIQTPRLNLIRKHKPEAAPKAKNSNLFCLMQKILSEDNKMIKANKIS